MGSTLFLSEFNPFQYLRGKAGWRITMATILWTMTAVGLSEVLLHAATTIKRPAGEDAMLPCLAARRPNREFNHWILPSGRSVDLVHSAERSSILTDGTLSIFPLVVEDSGRYACIVKENDYFEASFVQLQVDPIPEKLSAWQENKPRLIQGGVAGGCMAAFLFFSCLVYKLRWKKSKRGMKKSVITAYPLQPVQTEIKVSENN